MNQERKDARMIRMCVVFEPRKEGKFVFEPGKEGCKDEEDHVEGKMGFVSEPLVQNKSFLSKQTAK